jgi:hypothetical protein
MEPLEANPAVARNDAAPFPIERRRNPRQKVHSPAYASFSGPSSGMVLDLSEIIDISESGAAIQTSSPLEVNGTFNLCLDLSETKSYIHTTGFVVWADGTGRVGIRFPEIPDASLRELQEWLLLNSLVACANHAAKGKQLDGASVAAQSEGSEKQTDKVAPDAVAIAEDVEGMAPDYSAMLSALSAVQVEVNALGSKVDAALHLLAERARAFSRASGAAIALENVEDSQEQQKSIMVCRASAGPDAPRVGAQLQVGSGFSGECVRSGRLLRCDDSETDSLVDRETCRRLGIRSIVAVPVPDARRVIGLLEVFSPVPCAFGETEDKALERLASIIAETVIQPPARRTQHSETRSAITSLDLSSTTGGTPKITNSRSSVAALASAESQRTHGIPISRSHLILLMAVAATVALVLGFLLAPTIESKWNGSSVPQQVASSKITRISGMKSRAEATTLEDLRSLARQGETTAQFTLGARYATGDEVPQSYSEAVRWFSKAAEQGHVVAQATLGAYYWAGRGVPQDLSKAYFWSILARAGGDEASKYRVAVLTSRMSRSQVLATQQQADEWIHQHQLASQSSPTQ